MSAPALSDTRSRPHPRPALSRLEAATLTLGRAYADQMAAVADVHALYDGAERDRVRCDPVDAACNEIGATLGRAPGQAIRLVRHALAFRDTLPSVLAHVASGRLTPRQAEDLAQRAQNVTPALAAEVDRRVDAALSAGGSWASTRLVAMIDAIITRIDADALRIRRRVAVADRSVWCRNIGDGMTQISITCDAAVGHTAHGSLRAAARALRAAGDPRTQAQVMSDLAAAALTGHGPVDTPPDTSPAPAAGSTVAADSDMGSSADEQDRGASPEPATDATGQDSDQQAAAERREAAAGAERPVDEAARRAADQAALEAVAGQIIVHVIANRTTIEDPADRQPAYLTGHGVITADHARDLAGRGRVVPLLPDSAYPGSREPIDSSGGESPCSDGREPPDEDPYPYGAATPPPRPRPSGPAAAPRASQPADDYRPTAATARYLQIRDLTCTFPGCTRTAEHCDIDHITNHRPGNTTTANTGHLCRRHHNAKTHHGWRIEGTDDRRNRSAPGGKDTGDVVVFVSSLGARHPGPAHTGIDLFPALDGIRFDETPGATPTDKPARRNRLAQWQARIRAERAYTRTTRDTDAAIEAAQRAAATERERAATEAFNTDNPPPF